MSVSLSGYLVEGQRARGKIPPELRLLLEVVARPGGLLLLGADGVRRPYTP